MHELTAHAKLEQISIRKLETVFAPREHSHPASILTVPKPGTQDLHLPWNDTPFLERRCSLIRMKMLAGPGIFTLFSFLYYTGA